MLTACSSVPVKPKWPDSTPTLVEKCQDLKPIEGDKVAITEMLKVIVSNYSLYYECAAKVESWNEWYKEQKKIYEGVK